MLISRGQALWSVGRDEDSLADNVAGERLAVATGWTTAAAYLAHHVGWLFMERGSLADADQWLHRALERTAGDRGSHVRAVTLNGLGVLRLCQGELRAAADLLGEALEINEAAGRETSALANRGNLASALRQLGAERQAAQVLASVLEAYRRRSNLRGELSTLDERSLLHSQCGEGAAALETATRAHDLAVIVRDRKAQAQTAATVAQAHLTLGDAPAATEWVDRCLAIARETYPFIETRALVCLATARRVAGDTSGAAEAAKAARAIAEFCGFRLLEEQARTALRVPVPR